MKKLLPLVLALLLSGCRVRDTARLRSVETLGLDYTEGVITLSISTGAGTEELPGLQLSAAGGSIEEAMTALSEQSEGQELFYAHTRYLLLGEGAAPALPGLLDRFERAPELRLDLPVFCVQGNASELVTHEETEIGGLLRSLTRSAEQSGLCHIYTLLELDRSRRETGYGLCAAFDASGLTGYAHWDGDTILYCNAQTALGLTLLREGLSYAHLSIPVGGGYASIETEGCRVGQCCDYALRELSAEVTADELNAAVAEELNAAVGAALNFLGSGESAPALTARLIRGYDLTRSDRP